MADSQQALADNIVETFDLFDDWDDRYRLLIDMGRKLPPLDDAARTEANRIQGCQSKVWVVARTLAAPTASADASSTVEFDADSDSAIVKGLIAVLRKVYNGQPADKVLAFDIENLLERLGLDQHLSLNRRNGLQGMVQRIKTLAAQVA